VPPPAPDEPNFYKEAFMEPVNLVFLITALVVALLTGGLVANVLMLFAAAGELMYLGTLPRNERYQRVVRSRRALELRTKPSSDREIVRSLSSEDQKRYVRFRNYEKTIREHFGRLSYTSRGLLDSHLQKLDGLLDAYLRLLQLKDRYAEYQERTGEADIVRDIEQLRAEVASDPPRVASVKQRRMSVLEKRLDKFRKAGENLAVIDAQLATIEDVTKYIYEQSLTMQRPDEVSFQLDTLMSEVEETQASVSEIEELFMDPTGQIADLDLSAFDASRAEMDRIENARAPRLGDDLLDPDAPSGDAAARRTRERE